MKKGHIYFIMWISGSGKWTLIENLKNQNIKWLYFLKSYVTRPMRTWEIDWNIYNFISNQEFQNSINKNEFLEYEYVHNLNYYWTKYSDTVENWIDKWKKVLKEIEIQGLKNIFKNYPGLKNNITSIFLDISEKILEKRINLRWENMSKEELQNRKNSLINEKVESKKHCDYIINTWNKKPDEVLKEVLDIINK